MSKLTSPTHVKQFLLDHAKKTRAQPFARVSADALNAIESAARIACINYVKSAPSKGITL